MKEEKNSRENSADAHTVVRGLVAGELVSRGIYAVVELGVPDELVKGPAQIEVLASAVNARANPLYRLLRFLSSFGLFRECAQKTFELTESGVLLTKGHHTLHSFVKMFSSEWNQRPFDELLTVVRDGRPAFKESMGCNFFEYLKRESDAGMLFNDVMGDFLSPIHTAVSVSEDYSKYGCIIDVGGGRGSLLAEILKRYPEPEGIVMDLPLVANEAALWVGKQKLGNRMKVASGDFFNSVPGGGDLYLLCRVIHDWDDEDAVRILSNIRRKMKQGSKLFIVEQLMPLGDQPSFIKTTDLWMLLMFHNGRERTELEMRHILDLSGLELSRIINTEVNDVIIEAIAK